MARKIDYAAMFTLRPDGRYQGYWRELDKNGEPTGKRHTICDKDPKALYDRIQEKESPAPLTFGDIAAAWHDYMWQKLRPGTQGCYAAPYKRIVDLFGKRIATDIEAHEISNHLEYLKEQNYSAKTIKTHLVIYRAVYRHAIIDPVMGREIRINPALNVSLPANMKASVERTAPEDDIVEKIRASYNKYFGLFPLFLMSTGFRRGEALAVRWRDIDFKKETITCNEQISYAGGVAQRTDTKTKAGRRTVPILPDLLFALRAAMPKDAKPDDYIFHGEDPSKFMVQSTYRRRWMHYCKAMDFVTDDPVEKTSKQGKKYIKHNYKSTITAHVLRHGYATMLFEAGVDVYTAQALLGHANIETTIAVYTHLRKKKKQQSIDKLKEHVARQMSEPAEKKIVT